MDHDYYRTLCAEVLINCNAFIDTATPETDDLGNI